MTEVMLTFVHIASGEGLLWLIIIIGSIVAQIVKASRRNQQRQDAQDGTPRAEPGHQAGPVSPEEELREFIRSLTGQRPPERPKPTPAATAPSMPPPRTTIQTPAGPMSTIRGRMQQSMQSRTRQQPAVVQPISVAPIRVARPVALKGIAQTKPIGTGREVGSMKHAARRVSSISLKQINGREPLHAAILWREILGPPVGLRKQGANATSH